MTLKGTLTCTTQAQAARVHAALPAHIALTRTEAGCISFEVVQAADPMVWTVSEHFADAAAFDAHQVRTAASPWTTETQGIARDYKIDGLR